MKPKIPSAANLALVLGVLVFALVGCANQSVRIEAVDANTRAPLAGVTVEWMEHRHQMFRPLTHYGPTNFLPSDQDGMIEVHGLHQNWFSTFVFSCPGRSKVYGRFARGVLNVATNVVYYPPGELDSEFRFAGDTETAIKTNGCFLIAIPK